MSVFQIGLLTAGLLLLIGGAALAVIASRIAAAGRAAQAEADIRLAASQELAVEVKRLAEKVEQSLAARDAAIENAFLRHNEACMASVQSTLAAHVNSGCAHVGAEGVQFSGGHDDVDDDQHKKHHKALPDEPQRGDSDDGQKKHHAANDDAGRPSFFARLFRRYP
jgi:hypothetical protein